MTRPFDGLNPDVILDAVEGFGMPCDGHLLALNSYENRVYQVGIDDARPVVAKFYRPGRWQVRQIREEHAYAQELAGHELPMVAPLRDANGESLFEHAGFRFALYPRHAGGWPELLDAHRRRWMGRLIGRIHGVGAVRAFAHRPALDEETFGEDPRRFLLDHHCLPPGLERAYEQVSDELLAAVRQRYREAGGPRRIRVHGDFHGGNVLWSRDGPHFVDLDDCRMAPAVQDLWMLLSGTRDEMRAQLADLLEGYRQFADFDHGELRLVEPLRALRMLHYAGWLARRWDDPAFPLAFPWFGTQAYWTQHVESLREQLLAVQEPPLEF